MNTSASPPRPAQDTEHLVLGTVCGLLSAIAYTGANTCLRAVADCDPIWVSTIKAVPIVVFIGPWLLVQACRGNEALPSVKVLAILAAAALVGQLGGNVLFQWSLGVVGIALTVPLCLGTIILSGALMGRIFLHEPVNLRTLASIVTLVTAICVLSLGAGDAHRSVTGSAPADSSTAWWILAAGVAGASLSGLAYSILGVVIRYGVTGRASLSVTMFTVGIAGVISLGSWSQWRIGWQGMSSTAAEDLGVMAVAGLLNFLAFLALTKALQLATVVYVNALNATQAAMAAVVGIILFQEAPSEELVIGLALTIAGLLLMKQGQRKEQEA